MKEVSWVLIFLPDLWFCRVQSPQSYSSKMLCAGQQSTILHMWLLDPTTPPSPLRKLQTNVFIQIFSTCCNFSNFMFPSWKMSNFQQMGWDKTRQYSRPDGGAFHSPAPNKHSNTSVKSNNFTINEIPICLQCISHWHFPHCNRALIKFLKCKNASKRLKTSPCVSAPGRGLWYLIFIGVCPGHRKPEC